MKTWVIWLKGLVAAIIGGAANAVVVVIVDPANFNLNQGKTQLGMIAGAQALISAALYLKRSPLPGVCDEEKK